MKVNTTHPHLQTIWKYDICKCKVFLMLNYGYLTLNSLNSLLSFPLLPLWLKHSRRKICPQSKLNSNFMAVYKRLFKLQYFCLNQNSKPYDITNLFICEPSLWKYVLGVEWIYTKINGCWVLKKVERLILVSINNYFAYYIMLVDKYSYLSSA